MVRSVRYWAPAIAAFALSCLPSADGQSTTDTISAPSAATLAVTLTPGTKSGQYALSADFVALDSNGSSYAGVQSSDVTFDSPEDDNSASVGTVSGSPTCTSKKFQNSDHVASVVLLMDQSGSISGTDPMNLRIAGAKAFLQAMSPGDEVLLMSFGDGCVKADPVTEEYVYGKFTTNPTSYNSAIDALLDCESGGTPLWDSAADAVTQLAQNSNKSNKDKALVIFTDGQDSTPIDSVISKAKAAGVKIFTVGLSSGIEVSGLSIVAQDTGGALFYAQDAGSMVSAFRGMNLLLTGDYDRNSCKQTIQLGTGGSSSGGMVEQFTTKAHVKVNGKDAVAAVEVRVPGPGSGTGTAGSSGTGEGGAGGAL